MRNYLLVSIFICLFLIFFVLSSTSSAQYVVHCTNCSDTFTQSLERVTNLEKLQQVYKQVTEAIKQTEQQIELVQNNIDQLENMVKNTVSLPDKIRTKILGTFQKLSSLSQSLNLQRGDASALSQIFSSTYAGTGTIRDMAKSTRETMESAAGTFDEMRKKWSEEVDRSQQAAFQESGMQIQDLEQKATELESQLNDLLTTPDGQMKALEAGNHLATMQLQEAQKLRSLLSVSVQASVQKTMKDEKKQQIEDEAWKGALSTDKIGNFTSKTDF
ncbi:P-type conjugative transfer protein TrbJ [Desulfovibrio sp. DV]|uniref:P-type conjugative transfer protein TrbJ n=1 Tax=Desulfovibrio sp. DV TaxID=1844708 RepID=UPI00094B8EA7|nr:P-type conjugative transfer protein TrbJ [Desulfovibrio sp. DV]